MFLISSQWLGKVVDIKELLGDAHTFMILTSDIHIAVLAEDDL
jgi:hypothetical protein